MQHPKRLAKRGAAGYDTLILINLFANFISAKIFRKGKLSFAKKIKDSVKNALKFIHDVEQTAASIGISNHYDYVVRGHIHQPEMRVISNAECSVTHLNSGDWIENLTALEYSNGEWRIYQYNPDEFVNTIGGKEEEDEHSMDSRQLFNNLPDEFNMLKP